MKLGFTWSCISVALCLLLAGPLAGASLAAGPQQADAPKAWFTAEQAARGEGQFRVQCAACHGSKLEGGAAPALSHSELFAQWGTAGEIYEYYSLSMPPYAPGQLDDEIYTDILSYILSFSGYPAGATELPFDLDLFDDIILTPQD